MKYFYDPIRKVWAPHDKVKSNLPPVLQDISDMLSYVHKDLG